MSNHENRRVSEISGIVGAGEPSAKVLRIRRRAQKLAATGAFENWMEIRKVLRQRWNAGVDEALADPSVRLLINRRCEAAILAKATSAPRVDRLGSDWDEPLEANMRGLD